MEDFAAGFGRGNEMAAEDKDKDKDKRNQNNDILFLFNKTNNLFLTLLSKERYSYL